MRYRNAFVPFFVSAVIFSGNVSAGMSPKRVSEAHFDSAVREFVQNATVGTSDSMRVIVTYKPWALPLERGMSHEAIELSLKNGVKRQERALLSSAQVASSSNVETIWIANSSIMNLSKEQILRASESEQVESVTDAQKRVQLSLVSGSYSAPSFTYGLEKLNVPALRLELPDLLGRNVRVGTIDTGIDSFHPDLRGKLAAFRDFTDSRDQTPGDENGHGTHVAGTIAGGASSGVAIGVAPGAKLLIARAFSRYGGSTDEGLLKAMQWMADPDENPATNDFAQVVSNSWNSDDETPLGQQDPEKNPYCVAAANWERLGMIGVFGAGNDGPGAGTIKVPGACPAPVTVAATDDRDEIASFSSHGPSTWKSVTLKKPDISAPGVGIYSASPGGGFQEKSGTSMATPHIAGVLAVLLQRNPALTPAAAKKNLADGAKPLGLSAPNPVFGAGRADVLRSVHLAE